MIPSSLRMSRKVPTPAEPIPRDKREAHPSRNWRGVLHFMRTVRIGLLGLGHVGSAVVYALRQHGALFALRTGVLPALTRIAVKHLEKPREVVLEPGVLTDDAWTVVRDPRVDVVVEAIGGIAPAGAYVEEALRRGKSVVTANKQLVSALAPELEQLAARVDRIFAYEASVGGAVPVIRLLKESLLGDRVTSLLAIINGTANYILTRMEEGEPFEGALAAAQELGLAEPDPSDDVDGRDAAAKLAIVASLAFDACIRVDQIPYHGIGEVSLGKIRQAREAGAVIRLLATARRRGDRVEAGVFPAMVPISHPLARVRDEENGFLLRTDLAGDLFITARGAGGLPTASAIMADLAAAVGGGRVPKQLMFPEVVPLSSSAWTITDVLDGVEAGLIPSR